MTGQCSGCNSWIPGTGRGIGASPALSSWPWRFAPRGERAQRKPRAAPARPPLACELHEAGGETPYGPGRALPAHHTESAAGPRQGPAGRLGGRPEERVCGHLLERRAFHGEWNFTLAPWSRTYESIQAGSLRLTFCAPPAPEPRVRVAARRPVAEFAPGTGLLVISRFHSASGIPHES